MTAVAPVPTRPSPQRPIDPLISVVCPVYCEEETIREFYRRTKAALEAVEPPVRHEILFVNNASHDRSLELMHEIAAEDDRVAVIDLSRNFGHQSSITCGLDHARGDAVIALDTDLQDPPEVMLEMVERWRDGFDVVYGVRTHRPGESRTKMFITGVFYRVINRLSDTTLPVDSGDFRLLDHRVQHELCAMRENNRYIRGLVAWLGFEQTAVHYRRETRHAGESKYPFGHLARLAVDAVTSFSERPLRAAFQLGSVITTIAAALIIWRIVAKIVNPDVPAGYTSLMAVILFFGGIQLLALGLLGEYVGRIYKESKHRPLYVVRDRWNVSRAEPPPPRVGFGGASDGDADGPWSARRAE